MWESHATNFIQPIGRLAVAFPDTPLNPGNAHATPRAPHLGPPTHETFKAPTPHPPNTERNNTPEPWWAVPA